MSGAERRPVWQPAMTEPVVAHVGDAHATLADVLVVERGGPPPTELLARYPGATLVLVVEPDVASTLDLGRIARVLYATWVASRASAPSVLAEWEDR